MAVNTSLILTLLILFLGSTFIFGQQSHKLSQKEVHSFKMAKKHHYAGQQYFLKKKYPKAEKAFLKCIQTFPNYSSANYYLAKIYYHQGDYKNALSNIETAKKHYKFMHDLLVSTQLEYLSSLRRQKDNITKDLTNSELTLSSAQRATMQKNVQDIDAVLNNPITSVESLPADYHYIHGNIFFKTKRLKEAHEQYIDAVGTDPAHASSYNNLISLYLMIKRYDAAAEYIKKAEKNHVKINPKLKEAVQKATGK